MVRQIAAAKTSGRGCTHRQRESATVICGFLQTSALFVGGKKEGKRCASSGLARSCFLETLLEEAFSFHHHYVCRKYRQPSLHPLLSIPVWDMGLQPAHFNELGRGQSEEELVFRTGTWERCRESCPDIFSSSHYKPNAFRVS